MDYVLIDLLAVPNLVIWAWLCVKVLPMRHGSLFIAYSLALVIYNILLTVFIGAKITPALGGLYYVISAVQAVGCVILPFVLPLVWYEGRKTTGLVLSIVVNMISVISETISQGIFSSMAGVISEDFGEYYEMQANHFSELIFSEFIGILVTALLFLALYVFLNRGDIKLSSKLSTSLLFPLTQFVLIAVAYFLSGMFDTEMSFYGGLAFLCIVCLVADCLFFVVMKRSEKKQLEDQRAEMLQEQLAASLVLYGSVVQEVESMARFRHDFRNQTHVIFQLLKQGHRSQAQECVDALRERL